jgi:signal transduction histidine kinase
VYVAGAIAIARRAGATTTYAGHSVALAWCFGLAGLAILAAGVVTLAARRRSGLGVLAAVAALLWFAPVWDGWIGGPELVRSTGQVAASLAAPVLVHLVFAAARRPLAGMKLVGMEAVLVWPWYALAAGLALAIASVRDPYLDPYCWANCTVNLFEWSSRPDLARGLVRSQVVLTAVLAAAVTALCVVRIVRGGRTTGQAVPAVLPGGALLGAAVLGNAVLLLRDPLEDPSAGWYSAVFVARCGAVFLIAVGVVSPLVRARLQRRSVQRIITAIHEAPPVGGLAAALGASIDDPHLRIHYWLPAAGYHVDADGHRLPRPLTSDGLTTTPLLRGGETIAVVVHSSDRSHLERCLGPAARLALDNERLQAESRARMIELTDSRERIVKSADARRRSLERDLHDGAQQSLLSMSYQLQTARAFAASGHDSTLAELVDSAVDEVRTAFEELRELAHGIYPAVLSAAGLCPALWSYAAAAPVDIGLDCVVPGRLSPVVETTAYVVVVSAVDAVAAATADPVSVSVRHVGGSLAIDIAHHGGDVGGFGHLDDRVGAIGGRLDVSVNRLEAELPCGS